MSENNIKSVEMAAKKGDPEALYELGSLCLYPPDDGFPYGVEEGIEYLTKAADLGNNDAADLLGKIYFADEFECEDDFKAFEYSKRAANAGYVYSQCRLGYAYATGRGVDCDENESVKWFELAASAPWDCQYALSVLHDLRSGMPLFDAAERNLHLLLRVVCVATPRELAELV